MPFALNVKMKQLAAMPVTLRKVYPGFDILDKSSLDTIKSTT